MLVKINAARISKNAKVAALEGIVSKLILSFLRQIGISYYLIYDPLSIKPSKFFQSQKFFILQKFLILKSFLTHKIFLTDKIF